MSGSSQGDAEGGQGSAWVTGVLAEGGNRHARVDPNDSLGLRVPLDIGGAVTGGVDVAVEDLDAHHQRAKAAGAQIVQELTDDGYGRRCGDDLEGHPWGFGDYRPSDEEVDGPRGREQTSPAQPTAR